MENKSTYGKLIRRLREQRAWTQEHLAGVSDLNTRTIQRIENGEVPPSKESLMRIADAFDLNVRELISAAEGEDLTENQIQAFVKEYQNVTFLPRMTSGHELLKVIGDSHAALFEHDDLKEKQHAALVGSLLDDLKDLLDIWSDTSLQYRAEFAIDLTERLNELDSIGYIVFGIKKALYPKQQSDTTFLDIAYIIVRHKNNPGIVKTSEQQEMLPAIIKFNGLTY